MERVEVLRLLAEREAACRAELDRLAVEAERIAGLLEACRHELERVVTARTVVGELVMVAGRAAVTAAGPAGVMSVADAEVGAFTQRVLDLLGQRGAPVRCREVVAALGEDPAVARHVERVRHRLKKLAVAGRVVEVAPGVFTLPDGLRAAVG